MLFKLEKPQIPKNINEELALVFNEENFPIVSVLIKKALSSGYFSWDSIRFWGPLPKGVSKEALWVAIKNIRKYQSSPVAIRDQAEKPFTWSKLDYFEEFFHELDMNTGGETFTQEGEVNKAGKQKLIIRGIMEEAIASSQLEGASTSRQAAKKMLREGRRPVNRSEQMIVNNYLSMKAIEEDYRHRSMDMSLFLELHTLITKDTVDDQGETPRMRKKGEDISVCDRATGVVYYKAPYFDFVRNELDRFFDFANDLEPDGRFIHPIIKAIMLHFWIGYLHPFTDGNGRLARLVFYWYLIKKDYWAFSYLSISKAIKKSPKRYALAYVYAEQDDNDLTYFLDYNLQKIKAAIQDFKDYLASKARENKQMRRESKIKYGLNERQIQLLQYLHGDSEETTTLMSHMNVNQVAKMTASQDLKGLVKKGFLRSDKIGKRVYYHGTGKIKILFE